MMESFNMMMLGMIVFFFGFLSFLMNRKHLLSMLLSLELMMLGSFLMLVFLVSGSLGEESFLLYFLTMVVCESSLGLSILVLIVRSHGNDYFFNMKLLEC
ncbi:NADH dehydrogenase subunit 4L (mitochondrion) [Tachypleus tridentatus]|uniref:NADH-ubiquinone oxidoreductase chain 4L n=1 Tax=Tachypleus tridentatus TaxID=6853 RepID=C1KRK1_TACTR|nr:NADH dehydrogenase subunit 4L [Tachypleus tridentatus]ACO52911.1 NADH dehydrogenase subunit 4L [Tachypleus tridentatus]WGU45263.1 NADH dehydrogenase subunit 4L [Tachypleus tridentatus]